MLAEQTVVKVEGTAFLRDIKSMGLSNTDFAAKNEYYLKAKLLKTQKDEINTIKSEVNSLKGDLQDIKSLLEQLMDKGRNG
jgi:archaellum component FlaC